MSKSFNVGLWRHRRPQKTDAVNFARLLRVG
jgi:hypothetical protein